MTTWQLLAVGLVWLIVGLAGAFGIAWAAVEWWGENPKAVAQCDRASEAFFRSLIEGEPEQVVEYLREQANTAC